ncbi:MAG: hypothetical protein ACFB8W_07800 [Elainellaceae cyanobacterium]
MSPLDLAILIVYTVVVVSVFLRAIKSFKNKKVTIALNSDRLKESLEQQNLQDQVEVKFKFDKQYAVDALPKTLALSLVNNSSQIIHVDWDSSTIMRPGERSRRVIRLTPYKSPDLSQAQAVSAVAPNSTLQEQVTAEDALAPSEDNPEILEPAKPLVELQVPQKPAKRAPRWVMSAKAKPGPPKPIQDFQQVMSGKPIVFSMYLFMRATGRLTETDSDSAPQTGSQTYVIHCEFHINRCLWQDTVPW